MSLELYNMDNMLFETDRKANLVFSDYVYENLDFSWVDKYWKMLAPDSVFMVMTDFHSQHRFRVYMEDVIGAKFINHLVWKNEWGNHPKNKFHMCYDDIIVYGNGNWKFDPSKIQVPKKTINKGLNPSGRITKQATAWIDDCTLTTTSLERQKLEDGHLIRWQKPLSLIRRLFSPFVVEGDLIIDGFGGTMPSGIVAKELGCDFIGIEYDKAPFDIAKKRLSG